jgi:long-chain fatty acid transport protein
MADDLSAIYYNAGGLGLLPAKKRKAVSVGTGVTEYHQSLFQGLTPGIGAGTTGQQETAMHVPAEAWVTMPVGDAVVLGFGAYTPFEFTTSWANPGSFAGRFLSERSSLTAYDLSPSVGFRITPELGVGFSLVYRLSSWSDQHRIAGTDPTTGATVDVADLNMSTEYTGGFGWSAGILHKPSPRFSWGASYRSAISTSSSGTGKLTQILTGDSQYDQLVAASFPFDQELALNSSLRYPYVASLGVAVGLTPAVLFEVDANRTGWHSVQQFAFTYPNNSVLNSTFDLDLKDSTTLRGGLDIKLGQPHLRLGYAYDQSPQPAATVGAFLPDADRNTFAVGIGRDWLDVAFNWLTYKQRIVTNSLDGLNGNFRTNAWLFAVTVTH